MARTKIVATNFEMFSGDTRVLAVLVLDQDGAVENITSSSAAFAIMKRHGQTPLIAKAIGSGIVLIDPANGRLEVTLDPADTEPLAGAHAYELALTDNSGRKTTVLFGTIAILRNSA